MNRNSDRICHGHSEQMRSSRKTTGRSPPTERRWLCGYCTNSHTARLRTLQRWKAQVFSWWTQRQGVTSWIHTYILRENSAQRTPKLQGRHLAKMTTSSPCVKQREMRHRGGALLKWIKKGLSLDEVGLCGPHCADCIWHWDVLLFLADDIYVWIDR